MQRTIRTDHDVCGVNISVTEDKLMRAILKLCAKFFCSCHNPRYLRLPIQPEAGKLLLQGMSIALVRNFCLQALDDGATFRVGDKCFSLYQYCYRIRQLDGVKLT